MEQLALGGVCDKMDEYKALQVRQTIRKRDRIMDKTVKERPFFCSWSGGKRTPVWHSIVPCRKGECLDTW